MCNTDVKSGTEMYAKLYPETSSDGVREPSSAFRRLKAEPLLACRGSDSDVTRLVRFCDWATLFQTSKQTPLKGPWSGTNGLKAIGRYYSRTPPTSL